MMEQVPSAREFRDDRPQAVPKTRAFKLPGLRWWIIGLIMLGSILNYLTRNTLSMAQVELKDALNISEQQYS
jgi:sugar phosphate permease